MGGEWEQTTLGSLISSGDADLQTGPFGTVLKAAEYTSKGVPLISVGEIKYGYFEVSDKTPRVGEKILSRLPKYILKEGDLVFGRKGGVDRNAVVKKDQDGWFLGSDGIRLRTSNLILNEFLSYQMRSPFIRSWLLYNSEGTTMPSLNQKILNRLPIKIPPIPEQKKISRILGALDDKIEVNQKTNQTLEQISQAIFKSWFVDFEPVRAKYHIRKLGGNSGQIERAAQAIISGAVNLEDILEGSNLTDIDGIIKTRLDEKLGRRTTEQQDELAQAATLFSDRLMESELALIPEGWGIAKLEKEFDIIMGQSPPGHTYNEKKVGIAFFQGRRDFGWRYPKNRVYCNEPKRKAKAKDTLLSVRAPVGDINLAAIDCCIGRGLAALRHKSGCEIYTYYMMMKLKRQLEFCYSDGTVFNSINQRDLKSIRIVKSPSSIVLKFGEILKSSENQIHNFENQCRTLANIRDALLPKLLSGEIEVKV